MSIIDVEIKETRPTFAKFDSGLSITPVWDGVDRPRSFSWGVKSTHRKLAERLKAAILAGVVFYKIQKGTDANGQTYPTFSCRVSGRHMNADLKRLGF
jgi:hypothetical protein